MSAKRRIVVVLVILVLMGVSAFTIFAQQEKITICHAAGRSGTTHFETLNLPYPAVYGEGGHFHENGTPRAGHEQDYLGPCSKPSTPTQPPPPTPTATSVIPTSTATKTPILPSETPPSTSTPERPTSTPKEPTSTPSDTPVSTKTPVITETPTPTVVCPTRACCYTTEVQIVVNIDSERDLELIEAVFKYLDEKGYACCTSVIDQ